MFRTTPAFAALALGLLLLAGPAIAAPADETVVGLAKTPSGAAAAALDETFYDYTVFEVDLETVRRQVLDHGLVRLHLGNRTFDLQLTLNDLRAPEFRAVIMEERGEVTVEVPVGTYAGHVLDTDQSLVRLTILPDLFEGYIQTDVEWLFIDPLDRFDPTAGPNEIVVYRDQDVRPDATKQCGVSHLHSLAEDFGVSAQDLGEPLTRMPRRFDIATEADGQYFGRYGNPGIFNRMSSALNGVDGIYRSQLNLDLNLVYQQGWPNAGTDPYTSLNAQTTLNQFRNWWQANRGNINRDVAEQFSGKNFSGSTIGIAWVGIVCNRPDLGYSVVEDQSSSAIRIQLSAHEIGHNFSANHDNQIGCPGVSCNGSGPIMCSFIQSSGSNNFSSCSRSAIASHTAANGSCLN